MKKECQRSTVISLPLSQFAHLTLLSNYCLKFSHSVFAHITRISRAHSRCRSHSSPPHISHSPVPPLRLISGTCFFCNIVTISFSVRPQFRTWYRSLLLLLFSAVALLFYCCSCCCRCCCCFLTCGSLVSSCFLYVKLSSLSPLSLRTCYALLLC